MTFGRRRRSRSHPERHPLLHQHCLNPVIEGESYSARLKPRFAKDAGTEIA